MSDTAYDRLNVAMKKRDRAITGISRWEEARTEAEAEIAAITVEIASSVNGAEPAPAAPAPTLNSPFQSPEAV